MWRPEVGVAWSWGAFVGGHFGRSDDRGGVSPRAHALRRAMLAVGQQVDRFTIDSVLGEGGMAVVYRVRHSTLGTVHALKLLKYGDESIQRRLVTEGQVQAALRSPNVVTVSDVLGVGGMPALLMEFIDGPSLEDWLEENRVSVPAALAIFRGVLAGVACAHRAGLIHRDLKPGNILLAPVDGKVVPKVADFGLAKVVGSSVHATRSATSLGTPHFMAPEQIRNAKHVDQRADIFSLGCILYHLVCAVRPFNQRSEVDVYGAICSATYDDPSTVRPDLPDAVVAAIRGCLVVDANARIQTCEALFTMLYPGEDNVYSAPPVKMGARKSKRAASGGREGMKMVPAETMMPGEADKFVRPPEMRVAERVVRPVTPAVQAPDGPAVPPLMAAGLVGLAIGGLVVCVLVGVIVWLVMAQMG